MVVHKPNRTALLELAMSRRTFMKAVAGFALAGVGGGVAACTSASALPLGIPLFSYTGHIHSVYAVAWSPDGLSIASGGDDMTMQVWNALDGTHLATYNHPNIVTAIAWSPDGTLLAAGDDDSQVHMALEYEWNEKQR